MSAEQPTILPWHREDAQMNDATLTIPLPKLEPKHLAEIFWRMDDAQQGEFFDQLGILVMATPATFTREIGSMFPLDWQMYHAAQKATPLGRDVMSRFSDNGVRLLRPLEPTEVTPLDPCATGSGVGGSTS